MPSRAHRVRPTARVRGQPPRVRANHGRLSWRCDHGHLMMGRARIHRWRFHQDCRARPLRDREKSPRIDRHRGCRAHRQKVRAKHRRSIPHHDCRVRANIHHSIPHLGCRVRPRQVRASIHCSIPRHGCRDRPPPVRVSIHRSIPHHGCRVHPRRVRASIRRSIHRRCGYRGHPKARGYIPGDLRFRARRGPAGRRSVASDSPRASGRPSDRRRGPCRRREPDRRSGEPVRAARRAHRHGRSRNTCHGRCQSPHHALGRERAAERARVGDRRGYGARLLPDARPARHR